LGKVAPPAGRVTVTVGETVIDITRQLELSAGKGWREMIITGACAPGLGDSFTLRSEAPMVIQIARVERQALPDGAECSF
jgi:beta-glucosidase